MGRPQRLEVNRVCAGQASKGETNAEMAPQGSEANSKTTNHVANYLDSSGEEFWCIG